MLSFSSNLFAYELLKPVPFKVGETLEYDIEFLRIKVARQKSKVVKITNINNIPVYHIHTDIKAVPAISKIYNLHDIIDTYINTNTLLPVKIYTKVQEGKWRNLVNIMIDQDEEILYYKDKKVNKKIKFDGPLIGLDSALYFLRSIQPEKDETIKLAISKKREVDYVGAKVKSLKYKLSVTKQLDKKGYVYTIFYAQEGQKDVGMWVTNDARRIPVKLSSVIIPVGDYGSIKFISELIKYKEGK